jgi:3-keto-L-gulonate-6-phosphate decarboxylase
MTFMAHEPGICRGMPPCMAWGQAAGTAAALAVKQGVSTRKVDIPTLRKTLVSQNVVLDKKLIDFSEITSMMIAERGAKIIKVD